MNLLLDLPPTTVKIDGTVYPINSDFRTAIAFTMLMTDGDVEEQVKIPLALAMFYPVEPLPENIEEALRQMIWFYRGGHEEPKKQARDVAPGEEVYSFEHDADLIYAAFLQQYGVDLHEKELHWWVFRALFSALNDETEIKKIMGYRAIEITNDMSKSQREFYRRMKKAYRLPLSVSEQAKLDKLEEVLKSGGDVSAVLSNSQ